MSLLARRVISLRYGIWSHSGLWPVERPVDLWVYGFTAETEEGALPQGGFGSQDDATRTARPSEGFDPLGGNRPR